MAAADRGNHTRHRPQAMRVHHLVRDRGRGRVRLSVRVRVRVRVRATLGLEVGYGFEIQSLCLEFG